MPKIYKQGYKAFRSAYYCLTKSIIVILNTPDIGKSTLLRWILGKFKIKPNKNNKLALYFYIYKLYNKNILIC